MSIGAAQQATGEKAHKFQIKADLARYEARQSGADGVVPVTKQIGA
jgi:hypothetical protein